MDKIQQEIKATLEEYQNAQKVEKHLTQLNKRIEEHRATLEKFAGLMEQEYEDFDALNKMSMKSLFYKALGSKEEQIEKEKQEYLRASLKFDETKKSLELLEYEYNILEKKLNKSAGIADRLNLLVKQREQLLIRQNTVTGRQLLAITKEIEAQHRFIRELREAIIAGESALVLVQEIAGYLRTARNWGNWDMASRGRRGIQTHLKHSNIDKARARVHNAKHLLTRFEDELRDVYSDFDQMNFSLELDSFSRFADIFFDNLITDWIVQQKIHNAYANVSSVKDRVVRMVGTLQAQVPKVKQEIDQLEAQKQQIVMS